MDWGSPEGDKGVWKGRSRGKRGEVGVGREAKSGHWEKSGLGVGRTWTGAKAAAGRTGLKRRTLAVSYFMS